MSNLPPPFSELGLRSLLLASCLAKKFKTWNKCPPEKERTLTVLGLCNIVFFFFSRVTYASLPSCTTIFSGVILKRKCWFDSFFSKTFNTVTFKLCPEDVKKSTQDLIKKAYIIFEAVRSTWFFFINICLMYIFFIIDKMNSAGSDLKRIKSIP